jgi:hypothetical protein
VGGDDLLTAADGDRHVPEVDGHTALVAAAEHEVGSVSGFG